MTKLTYKLLSQLWPSEEASQKSFNRDEIELLIVVCISLTTIQFLGAEVTFRQLFGHHFVSGELFGSHYQRIMAMKNHPWYGLLKLTHWTSACLIGYVLIPCVYLRAKGVSLSSQHLSFVGTWQHRKIYLALALIMLPPVILISFEPSYQHIYPFYKNAGRSWIDFLCWEGLYLSQFVALEFFFRGFMLARLRSWAGHGAVFIMIIPYCMIHFPKTWSESVGAVIAGIVLGALALRGRSIWGGAFLHCCVALTMDVLSLHHSGKLQNLIGG